MRQKGKFPVEEKLKYILGCIEGKDSVSHTDTMIGINRDSLRQWIHNYQSKLHNFVMKYGGFFSCKFEAVYFPTQKLL